MLEHHRKAIDNLVEYFKPDPEAIAVILGGSVAKGLERPNSDIDALIIVTDECYARREKSNTLCECISGHCDYEGGYFDLKYLTKSFLIAVAEKGSEPARNAFLHSRCLYSSDPEIANLIERIPVFQQSEKADKLLSFYSALSLNEGYFWSMSENGTNPYLRIRAISDLLHFGLRIVLEQREILFPCSKSLVATLERLTPPPTLTLNAAQQLIQNPTNQTKQAFVDAVLAESGFVPPADDSEVLTRFVEDNEQWWLKNRPVIPEW